MEIPEEFKRLLKRIMAFHTVGNASVTTWPPGDIVATVIVNYTDSQTFLKRKPNVNVVHLTEPFVNILTHDKY